MDCSQPGSSPGDLPNPGLEPRSPTLQTESLPAESQGKPKNTGVGSLSILQRIFLTQVSNQGLLHCRQILYQLNYQGSPHIHAYPLFLDAVSLHRVLSKVSCAIQFSSVQFSRSVVFDSLRPHESQHARPPCPSPTPRVHSDSRPLSQ